MSGTCERSVGRQVADCEQAAAFLFIGGPCPSCGNIDSPQPLCREHTGEAVSDPAMETFCSACGYVWTPREAEAASETYVRYRPI